ncbi:MAG: hypothetical protein ACKOBN_06490 [Flavobacteriales bacterium]
MKSLLPLTLILMASCSSKSNESKTNENPPKATQTERQDERSIEKTELSQPLELIKIKPNDFKAPHSGKTKFMWRDAKTFDIVLNQEYIKNISIYERAALGFVASSVGNGCNYEGEGQQHLNCDILSALNLGYQCSDRHLGFLRSMFKDDPKVLKELQEPCPEIVDGATSQTTFDYINIEVVNKTTIVVSYMVSGVYLRESISWEYTVTDTFEVLGDGLVRKKHEESKVKESKF